MAKSLRSSKVTIFNFNAVSYGDTYQAGTSPQQGKKIMTAKNITRSETLTNVHEDDEGTGIYWFIGATGEYEQVFVPRIKRQRSEARPAIYRTTINRVLVSPLMWPA